MWTPSAWRGTDKALSVCNHLCLDDNEIGDVGHEALATALDTSHARLTAW